ncbi:tetratricopeptide repeat protein [Roseibium algae]|uniref:Tetratricopeptide repeat protein n=1 Tax=Roseibium algae TaxID=3123038 RepID=A0ABU8TPU4_9HYPH
MAHRASNLKHRTARFIPIAAALSVLMLATGCSSTKQGAIGTHASATGQAYAAPGSSEARRAVSSWGARYEKNRQDKNAILGYASALRQNEQTPQAMAVLRSGVISHPRDRQIASAYGKILAIGGKFGEALNVLQGAQNPQTPDWKLMSAEAAVYDQMGNHKRAQALYNQALKIEPNEPSILNNLGLSHLLSNQLPEAEYTLRKAASLPGADSRVRQNLVLALGVQGKFAEAEQIARSEMDPRQAEANIAYLRQMMSSTHG